MTITEPTLTTDRVTLSIRMPVELVVDLATGTVVETIVNTPHVATLFELSGDNLDAWREGADVTVADTQRAIAIADGADWPTPRLES